MTNPRAAVEEHLDAFNAHDTARLLDGFASDAVWATGRDVVRGRDALAELFDDGLWQLDPNLELRSLVAADDLVATELHETITIDGLRTAFGIAAFFTICDGRIATAKVYREGSADLD